MRVVTHEDYLASVARAVCEQYPTTGTALGAVQFAFGTGAAAAHRGRAAPRVGRRHSA